MSKKAPNYTPEQTAELVAAYQAAEGYEAKAAVVTAFAEKFGRSIASIRQKLVREGVYQKKEYQTKRGERPVKKEKLADKIGQLVPSLSEGELSSLTKANKSALNKILTALEENR